MNPGKELFGNSRVQAQLVDNAKKSCADLSRQMLLAINEFAAGAEQSDDITMLILRWNGPAEDEPEELSASAAPGGTAG